MELSTYYYTAYGLRIGSDIPLSLLKEIQTNTVDLTIKLGKLTTIPPLERTKIYRAGLWAKFAQQGVNRLWLDWSPVATFMALNGNQLTIDTNRTDEGGVSLFTLNEALGLILFQKGYFLLHGSAIQLNGKGVVFIGEPGAGKSTTVAAFAKTGIPVMSDDMVCIRINEVGRPSLIPAFGQIKIWESAVEGLQLNPEKLGPIREGVNKFSWHEPTTFEDNEVPLERIYVLTAVDEFAESIQQLPQSRLPIELLNHFPLPDSLLEGERLQDHFTKTVAIAQSTPVFRMSRPANFEKLFAFVEHLKTTV